MAVVTCLAVIPPELGKDNFGLPAKILYVPAGSVEVYRKNAVWREAFETIYEGENETYIEASAENSGSILYDKEIRDKPRTRRTKRNV